MPGKQLKRSKMHDYVYPILWMAGVCVIVFFLFVGVGFTYIYLAEIFKTPTSTQAPQLKWECDGWDSGNWSNVYLQGTQQGNYQVWARQCIHEVAYCDGTPEKCNKKYAHELNQNCGCTDYDITQFYCQCSMPEFKYGGFVCFEGLLKISGDNCGYGLLTATCSENGNWINRTQCMEKLKNKITNSGCNTTEICTKSAIYRDVKP